MKLAQAAKLIVALGMVASVLPAEAADAPPASLDFVWTAPSDCPDVERVRAEVERILHGPAELGAGEHLMVRAEVRPPLTPDRWHVDIETDDGRRKAQRSLDAGSCDDVAEATALFIAVLIESQSQRRSPPSEAPPSEPPRSIDRMIPVEAPHVDDLSPPLSPSAGVRLGLAGGYLPQWSPGVGLYALLAWKAARVKLAGDAWLPARRAIDSAESQGADFQLYSAGVDLCLETRLASVAVGPCAGTNVALMRGTGFGPGVTSQNGDATFAAIELGASLRWIGSDRLSLPLELEALIPLTRPEFVFLGPLGASVHRPSRIAGRATLGVEFRL